MIDANEHFGLVYKIALEFIHNRNEKVEDTYEFSDGLLGLTFAIKNFNLNKSKFSTYAWMCIRSKIISGLRTRSMKSGHLRISKYDLEKLPCRNNDREIAVKKVKELMDSMPESSKKTAVVGWFLQKRNLTDIGKELGVGQSFAQRRKDEGLKELKKIACKIGIDFD
jgi:RNA polymerase sigma factor (sigma-70 family)